MPEIPEMKQVFLTALQEEIEPVNSFLRRIAINREEPLTTETIKIETKTRNRYIAPFVRRGAAGIMVPGGSASGYAVEAPNIRIKRPFNNAKFFFRRPGSRTYFSPRAAEKKADVKALILEDLQIMEDMILNAEEYLTSMMLQGVIAYEVEDEEVITITYNRPSANNITPAVYLDDADPVAAAKYFVLHMQDVFEVTNDASCPAITDAICGSEAADKLTELVAGGYIELSKMRDVSIGSWNFVQQFTSEGVLFLGELRGVRFWRYARTAMLLDGTVKNMIRPKYIEYISNAASSERVMFYAAIDDIDAIEDGEFVGKRFTKSWKENDPPARMALSHSRPLPVPLRLAASVSYKAVSG